MEFRDRGAEVAGGANLLKGRLPLILGGLIALAAIGVLVLFLYMFGVFTPGRRTAATTVQPTATRVAAAQATSASTPTSSANQTPNAAPTSESAQASTPAVPPSATAPAAPAPKVTSAPKPAAPPANAPNNPFPGINVTKLRVDPMPPRKNDPISFYVTFSNTTGQMHTYNLCVEAYRVGDKKPFGITSCPARPIQPGTSEVTTGTWVVTGIRECIAARGRAVARDGGIYTPFVQSDGSDLWLDFQVCP